MAWEVGGRPGRQTLDTILNLAAAARLHAQRAYGFATRGHARQMLEAASAHLVKGEAELILASFPGGFDP
eukprot:6997992-Lingulodinium_polyedra.AAC.1